MQQDPSLFTQFIVGLIMAIGFYAFLVVTLSL